MYVYIEKNQRMQPTVVNIQQLIIILNITH